MTALNHDPYGYEPIDIYGRKPADIISFNVKFDKNQGLSITEPSPAAHPHLEGIDLGRFYCVVDPSATSPDGAQPFTIYGPYSTEAAAQSLIDDGTCEPESSRVVLMHYPSI